MLVLAKLFILVGPAKLLLEKLEGAGALWFLIMALGVPIVFL